MQMANSPASPVRLYSIGHSNHELGRLVELLEAAAVTAVADVRSSPYSKRLPHFNRPALEQGLKGRGIAYVFLGDLLGGRPPDPDLYDGEGRVDYERVRRTEFFVRGLDRLWEGAERFTIAMLCSEEDPLDCHRGLLIAPTLVERGTSPFHLRGDGSVENTPEMEARLLAETKVGKGILDGLFAAQLSAGERAKLLSEAYQ